MRLPKRTTEEKHEFGTEIREKSYDVSVPMQIEEPEIGFQQPDQVLSQMDLKMMEFIQERLGSMKDGKIGFFNLVEGETKEYKVKAFQELLSLESKDVIEMIQDEPFGDIIIVQKPVSA